MLTDWKRERRSKVVPLQTWWSNSCSKYIPPYKEDMNISHWNMGAKSEKSVLRKPPWPARVPASSRRCRWPTGAAHACSPYARNLGTGLPVMSLSIPYRQTGRKQESWRESVLLSSLCLFYPPGLAATWLSSPSKMTMEKKHTDHRWGTGIMATARG